MFLAEINNKVIAAFILKIIEEEIIEIRNIAVAENWQSYSSGHYFDKTNPNPAKQLKMTEKQLMVV